MKIQTSQVNYMSRVPIQGKIGMVKCPHGNPGGTCPICMGMSGGGGSSLQTKPKPSPHELGLLTWADLLPAWYAMLAAKQRQMDNAAFEKNIAIKRFFEQSQFFQKLTGFIDNKIMPMLKLLDSKVLTPLTKTISQTVQTINTIYAELKTQLMQQMTKLAGVLNEKMLQIMEKLKQTMETLKNAMEMLLSNLKEKEKALKEHLIALANKVKKKLFRIIEMADKSDSSFEQEEYKRNHPLSELYEEIENAH